MSKEQLNLLADITANLKAVSDNVLSAMEQLAKARDDLQALSRQFTSLLFNLNGFSGNNE